MCVCVYVCVCQGFSPNSSHPPLSPLCPQVPFFLDSITLVVLKYVSNIHLWDGLVGGTRLPYLGTYRAFFFFFQSVL